MYGFRLEAMQVPCCDGSTPPPPPPRALCDEGCALLIQMLCLCVCVNNFIKEPDLLYRLQAFCLWHQDMPLVTGLWWQAGILSAADNAGADFGLESWLLWQQVGGRCWWQRWQMVKTCPEQSHYLIDSSIFLGKRKTNLIKSVNVQNECVRVCFSWEGRCFRPCVFVYASLFISGFSSLDDHSKCFTLPFTAIHPFTQIQTVHLWAALFTIRGNSRFNILPKDTSACKWRRQGSNCWPSS